MGAGRWTEQAFRTYAKSRGRSVDAAGAVVDNLSNQEIFRSIRLQDELNPKNVIRECCDSEEHPNVVPVILALDVTGSMGQAAVEVSKKLNVVMTNLYNTINDVEFMIMGIGDMACDNCPAQASQFESDIRIADQLEKIYFEFGGGGNGFESYSLAWYFALNHTKIDAINNRHTKGIIITIGDEPLNPYLPKVGRMASFESVFGDNIEENIDTKELYKQVSEKFECYHIHVDHNKHEFYSFENCSKSFIKIMGEDRVINSNLDNISNCIIDIVSKNANHNINQTNKNSNGEIVW